MPERSASCPKCGRPITAAAESCPGCSVIFAKLQTATPSARPVTGYSQQRLNRFRVIAALSYGSLLITPIAVVYWYSLALETTGWHGEATQFIWERLIPDSLGSAAILSFAAMFLTPRPGESGQGVAVAPLLLALVMAGLLVVLLGGFRVR